jgi:hypothetical protein
MSPRNVPQLGGDRVVLKGNNQMDLRRAPRGRPARVMEIVCPLLMM